MGDHAALADTLATDARYATPWGAGDNSTLVVLLNEDTTETTFQPISRDVALTAIGDGIRSLPDADLQKLRILLAGDVVAADRKAVRDEVIKIFEGQTAVLDRLQAAVTRFKRYGEAFGFESVSLADVRKACRLRSDSYYNRYLRGEV